MVIKDQLGMPLRLSVAISLTRELLRCYNDIF